MNLQTVPVKPDAIRQLRRLAENVKTDGDETSAERFLQLADKAERGELVIACCGHFSAGKSTLINAIIGETLLASGPIPTSANIVSIRKGERRVSVQFHDGTNRDVNSTETLESFASYFRDGERVKAVDITLPLDEWPDGIHLLDTPGVDSTDDAHRQVTEAALHMADVVLFVTDYLNAQSEVNFAFAKKVRDQGKPIIWVVNQIDKHQEWEVPFAEYRHRIKTSLDDWQLNDVPVFFTSLMDKSHPLNEWDELKRLLIYLVERRREWLDQSLTESVHEVLRQHRDWLVNEQAEEREAIVAVIASTEGKPELERLEHQLRLLEEAPFQLKDQLKEQVTGILESAPITPYDTRQLVEAYIASRQPQFKVGWLFSRKKTEQEISRRLSAFVTDLEQKVSVHIEGHVKELIIRLAREAGIHDPEFESAVYEIHVPITEDWVEEQVTDGPTSHEYILNFTDRIASQVKQRYKVACEAFIEEAVRRKQMLVKVESNSLRTQLERYESLIHAEQRLENLNRELTDKMDALVALWSGEPEVDRGQKTATLWLKNALKSTSVERTDEHEVQPNRKLDNLPDQPRLETDPSTELTQADVLFRGDTVTSQLNAMADTLDGIIELLKGESGLQQFIQRMLERTDRLREQEFTVALFGAFSAGKSSFANALIGEVVLPVSPTPTTAAVNRLIRPTEEYAHRTARIYFKTEEELIADISSSLAMFQEKFRDIASLERQVARLRKKAVRTHAKPHIAFLQAVVDGWKTQSSFLGQQRHVDWETYTQYVAEEQKACFVERIDLFVDCALTRAGIQLVDTPGADSVNARHTAVAFDYIKHADAIIFVTYYNHAFSKADRSFLEQLGRAKDSFTLDKMWFIINAIDLAQSEHELNDVCNYVEEQLVTCGIKNPRLYALSSQTALWAQQAARGNLAVELVEPYRKRLGLTDDARLPSLDTALSISGFASFLADFNEAAVGELVSLVIKGAEDEIKQTLHVIHSYIKTAEQDDAMKEEYIRQLSEHKDAALHLIDELDWQAEHRALNQEISELLYYVKQRLLHRMPERFNEAFHPSVLSDGRIRKSDLNACLNDLIKNVQQAIVQDLLTTSLYMERAVHKGELDVYRRLTQQQNEDDKETWLLSFEPQPISEPPLLKESMPLRVDDFEPILKYFKNAKDFFEGDGKVRMLDAFMEHLEEPLQQYFERKRDEFSEYYLLALKAEIERMQQQLRSQIEEQYNEKRVILLQPEERERWTTLAQKLEDVLENHAIMH